MNTSDEKNEQDAIEKKIQHLVGNLSAEKKQLLLDMLVEWQQKEQRSDSRIPCLISVDLSSQKKAYREFIHDLSRGGVWIETREPLKVGEALSMTFEMPNARAHFKITGEVLRSDSKGVAIRFNKKLSEYQAEMIKKAIK